MRELLPKAPLRILVYVKMVNYIPVSGILCVKHAHAQHAKCGRPLRTP